MGTDHARHDHHGFTMCINLVLSTGGVAGLPLDGVVPDFSCLLVLGYGVVSPGDADWVRGQSHSLDPHWGDHGSADVWHGGGVFIKEVKEVILRWVHGVWRIVFGNIKWHHTMKWMSKDDDAYIEIWVWEAYIEIINEYVSESLDIWRSEKQERKRQNVRRLLLI